MVKCINNSRYSLNNFDKISTKKNQQSEIKRSSLILLTLVIQFYKTLFMHKIALFIFIFSFFGISGNAQPNVPIAPYTIFQDIDGVSHNLYDYLDQGRAVVFEFYKEGHSITASSRPGMQQLHTQLGLGGVYTHVLFSVDLDTLANNEANFKTTNAINYPVISDLTPFKDFNIDYTNPSFLVICPDRVWKIRKNSIFSDITYITTLSSSCAPLSEFEDDGRILSYFGEKQYCQGEITAQFYIQNYSKTKSLTSAKISVTEDNIFRGETKWTGSLSPYEIDTVEFVIENLATYDILIFDLDSINLKEDTNLVNNEFKIEIKEGKDINSKIYLDFTTDLNPEQTSWKLVDFNGDIVFSSLGSQFLPNTNYKQTIDIWYKTDGCYEIFFEDSFGDGLKNGSTPAGNALGAMKVYTDQGDTILKAIDFESSISRKFYKQSGLDIANNKPEEYIQIINNSTNILIENKNNLNGDVTIHTISGKLISKQSLQGTDKVIETENWGKGIYLITVTTPQQTKSVKHIQLR